MSRKKLPRMKRNRNQKNPHQLKTTKKKPMTNKNDLKTSHSFLPAAAAGRFLFLSAFVFVALFATAINAADNELSPAEERAGWKLLFDGKTTAGWRNFKKDSIHDQWVVREGSSHADQGGGGDILSSEQYDYFELVLDYRIVSGGNSGLMFRVSEDEDSPWKTGPEVQIIDNGKGKDGQKSGWLYQLYSPGPGRHAKSSEPHDFTRPAGEWNQIFLRVTAKQTEIWMNGNRYSAFQIGSKDWNDRVAKSKFAEFKNFGKIEKGYICLQDHGDEVSFRNLKIRSLPADGSVPDPVDGYLDVKINPAFADINWQGWEPENAQGKVVAMRPIVLTHGNDQTNNLYFATQHGEVYKFENKADVKESHLLLDLRSKVQYNDRQNEEGFLGMAFHPKFKENGHFYAYYTAKRNQPNDPMVSVISRFTVSKDDPNKADPASEEIVLKIPQPYWNHNGGTIVFGPDGYLYIGLGDGGAGDDPHHNGQNMNELLGEVLRIDVDRKDDGKNYAIPKDNPFVERKDARPEIFALGIRNIWRMAFDPVTKNLWAGEVGQNLWEEIDIIKSGGNYGWNFREGNHLFGTQEAPKETKVIDPVWDYDHTLGKSITGGLVYRGKKIPELVGKYLYADYVSGKIWAASITIKRRTSSAETTGSKATTLRF